MSAPTFHVCLLGGLADMPTSDICQLRGEEANGQDAPLRYDMEELQQRMYVEGSVVSVFAQQVMKERVAGQDANHAFAWTISDMFEGSENPDPTVV
jgi:hypothetical protein